jgi:hypothetical protein
MTVSTGDASDGCTLPVSNLTLPEYEEYPPPFQA